MIVVQTLVDKRARGFLLFSIFIALLWLVMLFFVVDLATLYNQNAKDSETAETLLRRKAESPSQLKRAPEVYVYLESNQTLAAASLQRNITTIAADLNVGIRSFETIAPRADDPTGRLAAEVQFEIDENQVAAFLHTIENFKPAIMIEHLSLQATKDRDGKAINHLQGSGVFVAAWQVAP